MSWCCLFGRSQVCHFGSSTTNLSGICFKAKEGLDPSSSVQPGAFKRTSSVVLFKVFLWKRRASFKVAAVCFQVLPLRPSTSDCWFFLKAKEGLVPSSRAAEGSFTQTTALCQGFFFKAKEYLVSSSSVQPGRLHPDRPSLIFPRLFFYF